MSIDQHLQEIQSHPLFIRLKDVIENIDGWHNHEDVYSHSLATVERAKQALQGNFIQDKKIQELFKDWLLIEREGIKTADTLLLFALLHDCGKILLYKENAKIFPINEIVTSDQTMAFDHEYWGSKFVAPQILSAINLPDTIKSLLIELIAMHGVFNGFFFSRLSLSTYQLIHQAKAYGHGWYKELLFNSYCDCKAAPAFEQPAKLIEILFNDPHLYTPREYLLPE